MPREHAESNLKMFGKELGLEGLEFDENNTCILGIDGQFSMHLTYEPNSDQLYIYSPLLDGLPMDTERKLKLYERLLEGSMLGGQMGGGGVGVAVKEGLVLIHFTIDMQYAEARELPRRAGFWVEIIGKWRQICDDLSAGREPSVDLTPGVPANPQRPMPSDAPQPPPRGGTGGVLWG